MSEDLYRFEWAQELSTDKACPMCGTAGPHPHFVTVHAPSVLVDHQINYRCRECRSLFPHPFVYPDYTDDYGFTDYYRYFCELGAGYQQMIRPVQWVADARQIRTMLDVGCGVPVTADYARLVLGCEAVGVDPSPYAQQGGQELGIEVDNRYLGDGSRFDGKTFDLVYCSEVIEHVLDPVSFARMLADHVAPGGTLVVSTPNADFVTRDAHHLDIFGIVWPGVHYAIFTPVHLESLLRSLGFPHVEVVVQGHHLVAVASHAAPLLIEDEVRQSSLYGAYLDLSIERHRHGGGPLYRGFLFRRFRDAVNLGHLELADSLFSLLEQACRDAFGGGLHDGDALLKALEAGRLEGFSNDYPYFAVSIPYLLGMIALNHHRDSAKAFEHFSVSRRIFELALPENQVWYAEILHLYWPSVFHQGFALLLDGRREEAIRHFDTVIDPPEPGKETLACLAYRSADIPVRAKTQKGVALLQLGRIVEASSLFDEAAVEAGPAGCGGDIIAEIGHLQGLAAEALRQQTVGAGEVVNSPEKKTGLMARMRRRVDATGSG